MLVVICYDIFDDHRRLRVMHAIEGYGFRVQGSVYECYVDHRRFGILKTQVAKLIDHEVDRVRYYTLCGRDYDDIVIHGKGLPPEDPATIIL
ncbi:CRISPR-associated endonuclease Cas2 [Ferrovum myxofaciens]|uniref:CRISPR-associated endoribonuclease Cas2 n=1 Tax=Ferrovum myxofaciens TaxID=416213 RepID=A0A9E6SWZ8_9PROT|nr:CRISPR-associated endonuclease Cas2 [Ferrovum myxofaciens]MBU6995013.1 CRISPR-associated endonuclease Cas2 [Ferrovum myxofaciens]QKE38812.1 MAG: CRISPR-associated endonuclease Cas2 [Ferrovum myxofaciens]QKE41398.1 MAG: CRISPR-associated endonuclease Cas2 [Ferrovum myxofaciens]QWY74022.1 MAG: CRISPR-associated endonuclease Cas2 [Ferrovum myxofaciens]QWY76775.1 MAG: CRISPR-associated endonuclease Cas2 [Ferrovum myxofaciens]